jgi:hypothetical protein
MRNGMPYEPASAIAIDASFTVPENTPGLDDTPEYQDYAYNPLDPTQGAIWGTGGVPGIPYPVDVNHGVFIPGDAQPLSEPIVPMGQYDPWFYATIPQQVDDSIPIESSYGEATYSSVASFVAEWGGMPYPVRDYQDQIYSVLYSQRILMDMSGGNGTFYGPQQTVWESEYVQPEIDYQSVIYLGGGTASPS